MPKSILVDTTRCTACRGCQVGCKEWHDLNANETWQWGTHQNPPDLNPRNLKLVRFREHETAEGRVVWNFFPDQCRHCLTPICKDVADYSVPGAIIQEPDGIVLFTEKTARLAPEDAQAVIDACPYNIPRYNRANKQLVKCDFCIDRLREGLIPVCVAVCPTGCMVFGERKEMLSLAKERLNKVKEEHPTAYLADMDDVNVIFLLAEDKRYYYEYASFG